MVGFYDKFTESTRGVKLVMARMQLELDKLQDKAKSHDSESLRQLIARKSQELETVNKTIEKDRDSYFSEGEMIGKKVQAYMSLFSATA